MKSNITTKVLPVWILFLLSNIVFIGLLVVLKKGKGRGPGFAVYWSEFAMILFSIVAVGFSIILVESYAFAFLILPIIALLVNHIKSHRKKCPHPPTLVESDIPPDSCVLCGTGSYAPKDGLGILNLRTGLFVKVLPFPSEMKYFNTPIDLSINQKYITSDLVHISLAYKRSNNDIIVKTNWLCQSCSFFLFYELADTSYQFALFDFSKHEFRLIHPNSSTIVTREYYTKCHYSYKGLELYAIPLEKLLFEYGFIEENESLPLSYIKQKQIVNNIESYFKVGMNWLIEKI